MWILTTCSESIPTSSTFGCKAARYSSGFHDEKLYAIGYLHLTKVAEKYSYWVPGEHLIKITRRGLLAVIHRYVLLDFVSCISLAHYNIYWCVMHMVHKIIIIILLITRLKNKIENNSTWEGAFYQSEWAKINSSWVTLVFSLYVCCC